MITNFQSKIKKFSDKRKVRQKFNEIYVFIKKVKFHMFFVLEINTNLGPNLIAPRVKHSHWILSVI